MVNTWSGGALLQETRSESDFQRIAEAMPQLVWTATPEGTIEYFNRRWIEYTGLDVAHAGAVERFQHVVHPADLERMWTLWNEAIATGRPYEIEYRLRRADDGSYRWFLGRAVPVRDEGRITGWIGTATDIDEQRRARDSLAFVVEAGTAFSAAPDEISVCNELARMATEHFADWCFVTLYNGRDRYETVAIAHKNSDLVHYLDQFRDKYPTLPDSALAQVIARNVPMLFERVTPEQVAESAQDAEHLRLLELLKMHSAMIVPLADGTQIFGALTMASAESGHTFDSKDLDVASAVAARGAIAIANARMFDESKRTSQRLRFVAKASQIIFESADTEAMFEQMARMITSEVADACFIARIDGDAIRAVAGTHRDPALQPLVEAFLDTRIMQPDAERSLLARLKTGEPILRESVSPQNLRSRGWPYLIPGIDALRPTSALVVPLRTRKRTYGAIFAYYTNSGRIYNSDDLLPLVEVASRASTTIENAEALERERRIATTFQKASLPALIPQLSDLHFDAVYSPAGEESEVGGDWYDVIDLEDGSVVISVGDVTGQGLQAAVIMSKVRHAMGVLPRHERDPARILDSAGWFLMKRYPDAIVTAFAGIISPDRKTLRFANAGHPFPILRREGELRELRASGLPLGLRHLTAPAQSETTDLEDCDLLALYTDGLTEWSRDWAQGERVLHDVLRSDAIVHCVDPARLIEKVCTPRRAHDDVAILTVSVGPAPVWSFKAEDARAAENARTEFVSHLRSRVHSRVLVENAELVFGELIGNVVRHAPGPVEIELEWNGGHPVLHVIDSGRPFKAPRSLPHDLSESGRGLYIVQKMSREMHVERIGDYGNHVCVTLG